MITYCSHTSQTVVTYLEPTHPWGRLVVLWKVFSAVEDFQYFWVFHQYRGGYTKLWGILSVLLGDTINAIEGYIQCYRGIHSVPWRDTIITAEDIQYCCEDTISAEGDTI